ncbi:BEL1-like homeodomain protein 7 [Vigna unguiculata]|uniref:BEL1-like homeodomain protein 7 n=1 Tax=Vigna unguiculata TaxID=3917 RepID=UPI001015D8A4|nr:BEL1-like homeodomain protein 7 [Vigna unguiculata]XP_027903207.1 BEL1-like homeodomain protein 7 [Vigna unguiculata]
MTTYYPCSSNQRGAVPMLCLREPLHNSYPETPILPSNMTLLYMNSGSYSEALPGNSQQQSNCFVVPSNSTAEQQEILANIGGYQIGVHDFGRSEMLVRQSMDGQNLQGQGLSLSLGTHMPSGIQLPSVHDRNHCSNFDSFLGGNPSLSANEVYQNGSSRHSENFPPVLPEASHDLNKADFSFHGISSVGRTVPSSKYLKAVQQLLDEVVDIRQAMKRPDTRSHGTHENSAKNSKEGGELLENERPSTNAVPNSQASASNSSCELSHAEKQDLHKKLAKLLSMLDEVDSRYKQYYQKMQNVVSSFDVVAGCGAAKPYTALALQTISCHFRCLRDSITGQIRATQKSLGEHDASESNKGVGMARLKYVDHQVRQQRALQQLGMMQHAWRPQRGLPESSVSILRSWLFEHFLHPYPKDSEKTMLARQTGLTRSQVSNWFINARVRLWKPMIEDMYKQDVSDVDMDSTSSSENVSKATRSDVKISNDTVDDSQHCQSPMLTDTNHGGGQAKDLGYDQVLDTKIMASTGLTSHEVETEHRSGKLIEEKRPNFDNCGLFSDNMVVQSDGASNERFMAVGSTCQMSEFESFKSGSGVSLTLGLQHCEGGNFLAGESHLSFAAAASAVGVQTAELEHVGAGNQRQRFSSPHMLHDFVV